MTGLFCWAGEPYYLYGYPFLSLPWWLLSLFLSSDSSQYLIFLCCFFCIICAWWDEKSCCFPHPMNSGYVSFFSLFDPACRYVNTCRYVNNPHHLIGSFFLFSFVWNIPVCSYGVCPCLWTGCHATVVSLSCIPICGQGNYPRHPMGNHISVFCTFYVQYCRQGNYPPHLRGLLCFIFLFFVFTAIFLILFAIRMVLVLWQIMSMFVTFLMLLAVPMVFFFHSCDLSSWLDTFAKCFCGLPSFSVLLSRLSGFAFWCSRLFWFGFLFCFPGLLFFFDPFLLLNLLASVTTSCIW